jgi:hypothetical protein
LPVSLNETRQPKTDPPINENYCPTIGYIRDHDIKYLLRRQPANTLCHGPADPWRWADEIRQITMTRKIRSKSLTFKEYKYEGEYPALTIDFSNSISGFHNITDMELVSNCICKRLVMIFGGEYDHDAGIGHLNNGDLKFEVIADSACAWIEIIDKSSNDDSIILEFKTKLLSLLINLDLIYDDHDASSDSCGVYF